MSRPHVVDALGAEVQWDDRMTAWPIPAAINRATLSHRRVLFVGDAARASDVLTGEGIGQALLTGRLAAESIVRHDTSRPELAANAYERSVREHLFADHRTSQVLSRVAAHPAIVDLGMRLTDTSTVAKQALARWMFEDAKRSSLATPWRWRGGETPRPGAFV
jgi:flavin-dependent dehydrogenase